VVYLPSLLVYLLKLCLSFVSSFDACVDAALEFASSLVIIW
jgi:hypothetical protein